MALLRVESKVATVTGFKHVFDRESFHDAHRNFLEQRERKKLDDLLIEMERGFANHELHPSYLYNEVIRLQRAKRHQGYVSVVGAIGIGTVVSVGAYATATSITDAPATNVIGVLAGIVVAGSTVWIMSNRQRRKAELLERICTDLEKQYKVGTPEQVYPKILPDEKRGEYEITYKRDAEFNRDAQVPVRFREEHSLVDEGNRPIFRVVVENGVPKEVYIEKTRESPKHYWAVSRIKTERGTFPSSIEVASDAFAAYQQRVQRYVVFECN